MSYGSSPDSPGAGGGSGDAAAVAARYELSATRIRSSSSPSRGRIASTSPASRSIVTRAETPASSSRLRRPSARSSGLSGTTTTPVFIAAT